MLGSTVNLLSIFDICCLSTRVVLIKNDVLLLVPTGKGLELDFTNPNTFNQRLIKCGKIVSCLIKYSEKYEKWPEI